MPIINGIYTELTFEDALEIIMDNAPASIVFSPGPELPGQYVRARRVCPISLSEETLAAMMWPSARILI